MDEQSAGPLSRLPETHASILRLRAEGLDDAAIAARLGLPVESVGPLALLALRKLVRLGPQDPGPTPET